MIKKLKIKFILIGNAAIFLVVLLLLTGVNMMNYKSMKANADEILKFIVANDGNMPSLENSSDYNDFFKETIFATRYFIVEVNKETNEKIIDLEHIESVHKIDALDYMNQANKNKCSKGFIDSYRYLIVEDEEEISYLFLNCEKEIASHKVFLYYSILSGILSLIISSFIIVFFSGMATKPTIESDLKQKQFITNAGHELKTPLSVISANAEILEMEIGENEWIDSINSQVIKLNQLTKDLILLSRMTESSMKIIFNQFNMSESLYDTISSFYPLLENHKFTLTSNIEENIIFNGSEELIRQMFSLLIDNSIKYTDDNHISIMLKKENKNIVFTISNKSNHFELGKHDELFERFYRPDQSRNSDAGGSGIGLSIVKSIVETHKGKINVECLKGNILEFKITL